MTNFEKIKEMNVEEFAKAIINPYDNFNCENCLLKNSAGKCVVNSKYGDNNTMAIEWLESECNME